MCSATSSSVTRPSRRPRLNAKPPLVVASALKPSEASTLAEPASHGFGMTKGGPWGRARKLGAFSLGPPLPLAPQRPHGGPHQLGAGPETPHYEAVRTQDRPPPTRRHEH